MRTVVLFVLTGRQGKQPAEGWRNKLYTRSLKKVGFIDNRHLTRDGMPRADEHWLVEIIRENQSKKGGCYILKPLEYISNDDLSPLIHGMYEMAEKDGVVMITPHDQSKNWVMSPKAKHDIMLEYPGTKSIIINLGGDMWASRMSAEDVMAAEAKRMLEGLGDD